MEANELRLGNLCEYFIQDNVEKDYWVKNKIDIQDLELCLKEKEYFNKLYRPIPLTPEILEKCGFERLTTKSENGYKASVYSYRGKFSLTVLFDDGKLSVSFWQGNEKQYLHQLLNLIFSLTGEELTVNL